MYEKVPKYAVGYLRYFSFSNSTLILGLDAFVNAVIMMAIVIYGRSTASGRAIAAFT